MLCVLAFSGVSQRQRASLPSRYFASLPPSELSSLEVPIPTVKDHVLSQSTLRLTTLYGV
jgi:hypothetical protein